MNGFKVFLQYNWKYILTVFLAFVLGCQIGPSHDELAAANKHYDDVKMEAKELENANADITKENERLASKNEELQGKVDESAIWLDLTDEQREQVEADLKAAEENRLAEEEAKKEAEEQAKKEAEEKAKKEAEEQARKETEEQAEKEEEEQAIAESSPAVTYKASGSGSIGTTSGSIEVNSASSGPTVYRTPYGERYHLDPDCGGKNSYSISKDTAKASGLTPCKKCAQ